MITKIVKRDGRKVPFNIEKISTAIFKAAKEVGGNDYKMAEDLAQQVCDYLEEKVGKKIPTVEQVQDAVEYILIENSHASTAKVYILYRAERTRQREMNSEAMKMYEQLTFNSKKDDNFKNEKIDVNANTAMGTMLKCGIEGAKRFNKIMVLDKRYSKAHVEGDIHIHDLDFMILTTACCQIDLVKIFEEGYLIGDKYILKPKNIAECVSISHAVIDGAQNDQHGEQSISNFDYAMAIGVRKTYIEIYLKNMCKALELLTDIEDAEEYANIVLKRVRYQSEIEPTLNDSSKYLQAEKEELLKKYSNEVVEKLQKFAVKYTNKEIDEVTYQAMNEYINNLNIKNLRDGVKPRYSSINYGTDKSEEGRLVIKNMLLATKTRSDDGNVIDMPTQIFRVKEGINYNKEDINYDLLSLACEVAINTKTIKFSFIDAPSNLKYYKKNNYASEVAYMESGIRVISNQYDKKREISTSRGNLCNTSINLPRLGILANKNIDKFYIILDEKLDLVVEQLMDRYKIIAKRKAKNYPFLIKQGVWLDSKKLKDEDDVSEVLKHGTLSVGFVGLAETLRALIGVHHGESNEAKKLGIEIVSHIRKRLDDEAKITGFNYTLFANSKDLPKLFLKLDKARFGEIPGITDKDCYTNSFHIPTWYNIDVIEKIKIEAPYHELTNGGHICDVQFESVTDNQYLEFENILKCMKESGIGFGSINCNIKKSK